MKEYWNDNSGKDKLIFAAEVAGGTLLFAFLPGVVLGVLAAAVVLGFVIMGFKNIL